MKKLLLTGIAVLLLATGTAQAVEIPKQYRGAWCPTNNKPLHSEGRGHKFESCRARQ